MLALLLDNFRQFQSTLPRGERLSLRFSRLVAILISIHAPARGATRPLFVLGHIWFISIHAPARGATVRHVSVYFDIQFQSTLPRGERRISSVLIMSTIYFNPRSREGSDVSRLFQLIDSLLFQSTLPRGERLAPSLWLFQPLNISIHAPARGATTHSFRMRCCSGVFQSTLPRGERLQFYLKFTLCF